MMIRPITLFCAIFAGISGMVLYAQKHKTTQLDRQITKIVYDTQRIKSQTAMLRTEWTLLNQPDRLRELSTKFLPGLRPLNPTQFVQMSAIADFLPPVKQDQDQDKTRDQLKQAVASHNGQASATIVENTISSPNPKEPPIFIATNNENTLPQQKVSPSPVKESIQEPVKEPVKPIKQSVVAVQNNTVPEPIKPVRRKKIQSTEIANAEEAVEKKELKPQTTKKTHIENVSYNIQSGNPFSHNKENVTEKNNKNKRIPRIKPSSTTSDDSTDIALTTDKKATKPTRQPTAKKQTSPIKVARYETKKNNYSESALGNSNDEALPAPVPFAQ